MSIKFHCSCGKKLKASVEQAGTRGKCPACGREFAIPAAAEPEPPPILIPAIASPSLPCVAKATPFDSRYQVLSEAQVVPDASRCVQCGICSYNVNARCTQAW